MSELALRSQQKHKTIAAIMTGLVLFLIFLILKNNSIPRRDLVAEHYDNIDWIKYMPQPKEVAKPEEPQAKEEPEAKPVLPEPSIKRIDLGALENAQDFNKIDLEPQELESKEKGQNQASPNVRVDIDESSLDNFNLAFNDEATLISPGRLNRKATRNGNIELKAGQSSNQIGLETGGLKGNIDAGLKGPEGTGTNDNSGRLEVGLKSLSDFGESFEDFSPIYKPLIDWMKQNPAKLPPVVKKFMDYASGDLTSHVKFEIQSLPYEMFLLCVERTYEVRIALLHELEVTYLIDQGFRKKSNLLRVGQVNRISNNEILNFGTNLQPAESKIARKFYQIFLSWWESVKHEVE